MTPRQFWTSVHRYVGLVMATFLVVAGLTGSLLAWNDELEAAISPSLFKAVPPSPIAKPLSPLALRERVQAWYPWADVSQVSLAQPPGKAMVFFLRTSRTKDAPAAPPAAIRNDEVFVNPYTGQVQGERRWGDLSQGRRNLMPFIFRLHHSLALGEVGNLVFGIVALLWTFDCFVGAYLTFPVKPRQRAKKPWPERWWPAWKVRWQSGGHKMNVDLHRAGGLWVWAMLFVLAWSSVAFSLRPVYNPVMRSIFKYQKADDVLPVLAKPQAQPGISWETALNVARRLMAEQAQARGFGVLREERLSYYPDRAIYRYDVLSERDIRDHNGATMLMFDANTGAFRHLWLPTGEASGDTIRMWLTSLHMARVWGVPFQIFLTGMGLVVAMLSVTGVIIWLRKRAARKLSCGRERGRNASARSAASS